LHDEILDLLGPNINSANEGGRVGVRKMERDRPSSDQMELRLQAERVA